MDGSPSYTIMGLSRLQVFQGSKIDARVPGPAVNIEDVDVEIYRLVRPAYIKCLHRDCCV